MFELREVTPRVQRLRERYRDAVPVLDVERVRLLTDYYQTSENEQPVLRRANALHHILSNMAIRVEPDELIVGNVSGHFRGCNLWPEWGGIGWLIDELDSGAYDKKTAADGYMTLDQADREYLRSVEPYWRENCISAKVDAAMPAELSTARQRRSALFRPGGQRLRAQRSLQRQLPEGRGEGLRRDQAGGPGEARDAERQDHGQRRGEVLLLSARWSRAATRSSFSRSATRRSAAPRQSDAADEKRRAELLQMADSLDWIMENPARTFHEALQVCYFYHMILSIEGSYLGLTIGRDRPARGRLPPRRPRGGTDHPGRGPRADGLLLPQDGRPLPFRTDVSAAGRRRLLQQHAHHHRRPQARRQRRHQRGDLSLPAIRGPAELHDPNLSLGSARGLARRPLGGRHRDGQDTWAVSPPWTMPTGSPRYFTSGGWPWRTRATSACGLRGVFRVGLRVCQRQRAVLQGLS